MDTQIEWYKVTNLTAGHVCLPWPEDIHNTEKAVNLKPHEVQVCEAEVFGQNKQGRHNLDLVGMGLIAIEPTEEFEPNPSEDAGRRAALSTAMALPNPNLEYLARQILEYPGDTLPETVRFTADGFARPEPGVIPWAIIMAEPRRFDGSGQRGHGPVDYRYLAETHRPFLASCLEREKLWRNRPAFVQLMEKRIAELSDATLLAAQTEAQQRKFIQEQGGRTRQQPVDPVTELHARARPIGASNY